MPHALGNTTLTNPLGKQGYDFLPNRKIQVKYKKRDSATKMFKTKKFICLDRVTSATQKGGFLEEDFLKHSPPQSHESEK